jgi:hypothetical protein
LPLQIAHGVGAFGLRKRWPLARRLQRIPGVLLGADVSTEANLLEVLSLPSTEVSGEAPALLTNGIAEPPDLLTIVEHFKDGKTESTIDRFFFRWNRDAPRDSSIASASRTSWIRNYLFGLGFSRWLLGWGFDSGFSRLRF